MSRNEEGKKDYQKLMPLISKDQRQEFVDVVIRNEALTELQNVFYKIDTFNKENLN